MTRLKIRDNTVWSSSNNQLPGIGNVLYGGGDGDLEDVGELSAVPEGEPSGELQGVAVGVKLLSVAGVFKALGVTALIPRSLSILAKPRQVENVDVELRRLIPENKNC